MRPDLIIHDTLHIVASASLKNGILMCDGKALARSDSASPSETYQAIYQQIDNQYPRFYKMDLVCQLATLTAFPLLHENPRLKSCRPDEIALVMLNNSGSYDADVKFMHSMESIPSPALFVYTLPNILIGEICIRYGLKGETVFLIRETPDMSLLYDTVSQLFAEGGTSLCLCGWCEAGPDEQGAVFWLVEKNGNTAVPFDVDNLNF